jgi:hypothetical protein
MSKQTLKSKTFVKVFIHFDIHHSFLSSFVDFLNELHNDIWNPRQWELGNRTCQNPM